MLWGKNWTPVYRTISARFVYVWVIEGFILEDWRYQFNCLFSNSRMCILRYICELIPTYTTNNNINDDGATSLPWLTTGNAWGRDPIGEQFMTQQLNWSPDLKHSTLTLTGPDWRLKGPDPFNRPIMSSLRISKIVSTIIKLFFWQTSTKPSLF